SEPATRARGARDRHASETQSWGGLTSLSSPREARILALPGDRPATTTSGRSDSMDERVPWDQYFMNIAQVVASRSTCPRKFVGAVIVRDRTILSTGYNGSIRGMPHCTDDGHMM